VEGVVDVSSSCVAGSITLTSWLGHLHFDLKHTRKPVNSFEMRMNEKQNDLLACHLK
jgi:hypothetical protein